MKHSVTLISMVFSLFLTTIVSAADNNSNLFFPEGTTFGEVIEKLEKVSNTKIYVKWSTLGVLYIDKNEPIVAVVDYSSVTLGEAIKDVLAGISGTTGIELGLDVIDSRITISTQEDLNSIKNTKLRVYKAGKALRAFKKPIKINFNMMNGMNGINNYGQGNYNNYGNHNNYNGNNYNGNINYNR